MSFGEHVSNQKGEKSTIKGLIDEIIKEIEIRHGLVSFPAMEEQEEYESEQNSEKGANFPTTFQNIPYSNCFGSVSSAQYTGHVLDRSGLSFSEKKKELIVNFKLPKNQKELHSLHKSSN